MLHPALIMRHRLALIAVFVPPIAKAPFMFYVKSSMKHRKHVICVENESYVIFCWHKQCNNCSEIAFCIHKWSPLSALSPIFAHSELGHNNKRKAFSLTQSFSFQKATG